MKLSTFNSLLPGLVLTIVLGLEPSTCGAGFIAEASGRLSQFSATNTARFEGDADDGPTVSVVDAYFLGSQRGYAALAGPGRVFAATVAQSSGISYPASNAKLDGTIHFIDNSALRSLIAPGMQSLDLVMRFEIAHAILVPNNPGIFRQVVGSIGASVSQRSQTTATKTGGISITNGPYDFGTNATGILAASNPSLDNTYVDLPFRISPFRVNGLDVRFVMSASANTLSLSPTTWAAVAIGGPTSDGSAQYEFRLSDENRFGVSSKNNYVFLADGRTAAAAGLEFSVRPSSPAPVPEPASFFLLMLAAGTIVVGRFSSRRP